MEDIIIVTEVSCSPKAPITLLTKITCWRVFVLMPWFGGPANFHVVGKRWPLALPAASHHLSSDEPEQISGSILWAFDQENLPHAVWLQGLGWPKAAVRTDSFCFSPRPSMVSSFPNDLFGIYQQLSCKFIQQSTWGIELYTQNQDGFVNPCHPNTFNLEKEKKNTYIHISGDGWFDSTCCFLIIISKEKVDIAAQLFGYTSLRVGFKMLHVTRVNTAANQDGACVNIGHSCSPGGLVHI